MKTFSTSEILDRLRNALNQSNDTELANFLGVKKATLSNWRSRNSLDWPLLFSFCEHIDLNWIIFGDSKAIPPTNQESLAINTNSSLVEHLDNKLKEKDKGEQMHVSLQIDCRSGASNLYTETLKSHLII